ncbi:aldose epimerase family protein [Zongyangia hominis]|uniref:Aldose 1-epimerase n=1 Tax=Zongyangia hominis TaxID=2763677 RepID=A0A926EEZ3_9FIRM|nr:aldose epimerase family protein [Zongyangia hominis]MBC8571234.1 galactose mutarotase [Zongyangia hominis]
MSIRVEDFGAYHGHPAKRFILQNQNGFTASVTDAGASIVSILAPDRDGKPGEMVLGYDCAEDYEKGHSFFGFSVGRHANRIGKGRFVIGGKTYQVACNDGPNHLHGGPAGFNTYLWDSEILADGDAPRVRFSLHSPHMDQGFPGSLDAFITFTLNEYNGLELLFEAQCDQDTLCNLTNHCYYNLTGEPDVQTIEGHRLSIAADFFTPCDANALTTGEIRSVEGTPFDFRSPRLLSEGINADDEQIRFGGGYDHNYCLNAHGPEEPVCVLSDPKSGRVMQVYTDQPGLQLYTGNGLDGTETGHDGRAYPRRAGLCLETQVFPNGSSFAHFPTPLLKAGEQYSHHVEYRFLTE